MDRQEKQNTFNREFKNNFIVLLIINAVYQYLWKQINNGSIGTLGWIVFWISGFLLFGAFFAFIKVFKIKFKNTILSIILSLALTLAVNLFFVFAMSVFK